MDVVGKICRKKKQLLNLYNRADIFEYAISEFQKLLKRGQVQNLSCENDFFGLVLKQRLVASRKWPITSMQSRISSVHAQLVH